MSGAEHGSLNILFAGVGGQGILFASKIFFEAALSKGMKVMGAETHGMSQRGGSVVSHFKMGDQKSAMVIPGTADILLALERTEGIRNLDFLKPGGTYLVNAPDLSHLPESVRAYLESIGARAYFFDADTHALREKKPLTSNLYLIGYLTSLPDVPFTYGEISKAVMALSKPAFARDNLSALQTGYDAAQGG